MRKYFILSVMLTLLFVGCSKKEAPPEADATEDTYNSMSNNSTDYESNDQPTGEYGDRTMNVGTPHNGTEYTLDVEFDGNNPSTIYFPKGGNVDLIDCSGGNGSWECTDEEGKEWTVEE